MNSRLKELRTSLKLSQTAFGERIGVSRDVINNIENARVAPTELILRCIAAEFSVSEPWLRNGEGEMFSDQSDTVLRDLQRRYELTDLQTVAVRAFLQLKDTQRNALLEYIETANNMITDLKALQTNSTSIASDDIDVEAELESIRQELEAQKASNGRIVSLRFYRRRRKRLDFRFV